MTATAVPAATDDVPLRRLPAAWLAIGALQVVKEFAVPIAFALVTRVRDQRVSPVDAAIGVGLLVTMGVVAWLRWRHVRWGVGGDRLVVVRGTIGTSRRELPLARIAGVSIEEPFLWRLLGLARLRVRTAAGAGDDAVLDAVPRGEVAAIRALLTGARADDAPAATAPAGDALDRLAGVAPAPAGTVLHRARTADLALAGLTGGALAAIGAALAVVLRLLDDAGLDQRVIGWLVDVVEPRVATIGVESAIAIGGAALALIVLVALPLAAALSVVRNAGLAVTREGATLVRRAGLLDRSERRIALATVQGVRFVAAPLQRALGGAALRVGTTGLGEAIPGAEAAGTGAIELVPLVRGAARATLAEAVLAGSAHVVNGAWRREAAVRVAVTRAVLVTLVVAGLALAAARALPLPRAAAPAPWAVLAIVALWGVAHVAGRWQAAVGAADDRRWLAARWGGWTRVTALARAATAEVVHRHAGPLQRRAGVCTVVVGLGDGTTLELPDVPLAVAAEVEARVRASTSVLGARLPNSGSST